MSTLCCAVLVEGGGVPGNAEPLSPMRIAIPAVNVSGELSCEDSPVTTPEASTDSDDCDSAFESDDDGRGVLPIGGRRRKAPSRPDGNNRWPGCVTTTASTNNTNGDKIIGRKTRQPTPLRKVRFTLHDEQHHTPRHPSEKNVRGLGGVPSAGARARYRSWGRERRAAIQASALQDVGMLARPEHQQQQHRRSPAGGEKESTAASTTFTTNNNNNNCDRTRARKKRATAAAPFKSTSANVSTTNTPHASSVAAPVAALVRVAPSFSSVPVPVSTKKRKMSTIAPSSSPASSPGPHRRVSGGDGGILVRPRDPPGRPPSREAAAIATAGAFKAGGSSARAASTAAAAAARTASTSLAEASAVGTEGDDEAAGASSSSSRALPLPLPRRRRRPAAAVAAAAAVDLSCKEELDVDALMRPKGEVRTPICRFLVAGWPEGVEGYEEQGGWRRLGGCHTRDSFPRGRRGI